MSVKRPLLVPLTPLYSLVVVIKRKMYRWGWLRRQQLPAPVISVGSVSAGGAGKTPFVVMLAHLLQRRGYAVSILTRGYGRASEAVERVEPDGDPAWHGDEPVLLAQRSHAPVFAASERYEAGLMAEQEKTWGKIAVHLLDDGFQHLRLARNVDIVLLTREDVEDMPLPAGNLREPLSAVSYAHIVVVRDDEVEGLREEIDMLRGDNNDFYLWIIHRSLALFEGLEHPLPTLPLAFCGIARPKNFTRMLTASRYEPMETMSFPDHHPYGEADIARIVERAKQIGANGFVTTEKDAVKLSAPLKKQLEAVGPLIVARLKTELVDEKMAVGQLIALVGELDRRKNRPLR